MTIGRPKGIASSLPHAEWAAQVMQHLSITDPALAEKLCAAVEKHHARLFSMEPRLIARNVEEAALALGIEPQRYFESTLECPALLGMKGSRIEYNLQQNPAILGMGRQEYVEMALGKPDSSTHGQPSLLHRKPSTLRERAPLVQHILKKFPDAPPLEDFVQTYPASVKRGEAALLGRLIVANKGLGPSHPGTLMMSPNRNVHSALEDYYTTRIAETAGAKNEAVRDAPKKTLEALRKRGILPESDGTVQGR